MDGYFNKRSFWARAQNTLGWVLAGILFASFSGAAGFPPISDEVRALTEVPGQPGASAVILFKDADLNFRDYPTEASSRMEVRVRIKILTEEGLTFGEISIPHSRELRLDQLKGRTVTSAGEELELPKEAVFKQQASRSAKTFVTRAAFPGVDVGSVIDYSYTFYWDSFFYLEPWLFHDDLPVVSSTIRYIKPDNLSFQTWGRETSARKMEVSRQNTRGGLRIEVKMTNLGPLPDEPHSFPRRDLSSRFMVIPTAISLSGQQNFLLESWRSVYEMAFADYKSFAKRSKVLKEKAKTLARDAETEREKAEQVYRWVRDELATVGFPRIWVDDQRAIKDVLETESATMTEKALILEVMLKAVGIDSERLWVANRFEGRVDARVANPSWFDGMILRTTVDGEVVYLDPSRPTLAFGMQRPQYESTTIIRLDRKKPEAEITPSTPAAQNRRFAAMKLKLDEQGKASGTGRLMLTGHQARFYFDWKSTEKETSKAWQEKFESDFPGWIIDEVQVEERIEDRELEVTWSLEQRPEEVLGDELSLLPSRPLEMQQPFTLPSKKRLTPVQMGFNKVDQVELEVAWPSDWILDASPESIGYDSPAGHLFTQVTVDESAHTLKYSRVFERSESEFAGDDYRLVKDLYERASKSDGQELVWVKE